ncbi:glycosyltransferase family 4 protein [Pelagicoccus sp. SDUM812003]|uniref:glycosyltransferase family 4 protein n=1 Tax=Pelagicoccus sp. SDUM812003 TaxID=3041267 RepID=UPI00280D38E7|nr:glycosyltransferase family 4 protein [Pelagicoccus sp. SDUM812003]MDQ8201955.1 glycosyltransferase family 4 protein [Pelagicoccus sp. SDUM812003]
MKSLQEADWDLSFACAAQETAYSADLEAEWGIPCHPIAVNDSSFDRWIADLDPEVVVFDRFMTEEQFGWRVEKSVPGALRALDTSDLHCLRMARHEAMKTGNETSVSSHPIALREIASLYRCDLTLMISEYEIHLLETEFEIKDFLVAYWPFALPDPTEALLPSFDQRRDFVMIGSFLHEPNWDAVRYCSESIWPKIRSLLPKAELHVYGSYLPDKAKRLHQPELGFHLRGRAEQAVETLSHYRVNLAPLRFGAGLKGKLADGFLAGTPSLASPIAAEGMTGSLPWGSEICEDPNAFASASASLHEDPLAWTKAQQCGFAIARQRFSEREWLPRLPKLLSEAFSKRWENRRSNFIGQLLRHHQHRSTEFMSRWIEAKNKRA